jgi:hypothetical protein
MNPPAGRSDVQGCGEIEVDPRRRSLPVRTHRSSSSRSTGLVSINRPTAMSYSPRGHLQRTSYRQSRRRIRCGGRRRLELPRGDDQSAVAVQAVSRLAGLSPDPSAAIAPGAAMPAAGGTAVGPDVQAVTDPGYPDRHGRAGCVVGVVGGNVDLIRCIRSVFSSRVPTALF